MNELENETEEESKFTLVLTEGLDFLRTIASKGHNRSCNIFNCIECGESENAIKALDLMGI